MLGCHSPDECERGLARLARINAARGSLGTPSRWTIEMLHQCRDGQYTGYDPVLRCVIASSTDEVAAACIDAFVKAVVKPGSASELGGKGLNPLLQP